MIQSPDLIETACIDVLGRRVTEHLAELERDLDLPPGTIERFNTIDLLSDEENRSFEELPAVLLAITGADEDPTEITMAGRRSALAYAWRLEVQVVAVGRGRADAMQRVRWLWGAVTECLMQRLPRACDPIESIRPAGVDFDVIGPAGSTLARCEMTFIVTALDSITVRGGLPVDDANQPPAGGPGGAPGTPYDPPVPFPVADELVVDVTRSPITTEET